MKTMLETALRQLTRPFLLLNITFFLPSFLSPNMAMAHVGDHHAMSFFHGLIHFIGEHYPFILGPIAIVVCVWILQKSRSSKR